MKGSLKLPITSLALLSTASLSFGATIFTENFDGLNTDNPGTSETNEGLLSGQGGWSETTAGGGSPTVITDPGLFGMSGNVVSGSGDRQLVNTLTGPVQATGLLTLEFDSRFGGYAYLGVTDGGTGGGDNFIWAGNNGNNLDLRFGNGAAIGGSDTVSISSSVSSGDAIRIRITFDPTDGRLRMSYAEYTDETTLGAFTETHNKLHTDYNSDAFEVTDITGVNLRTASGNNTRIDNILITSVPEPSSTALLGLGGLALILRRRK